MIEKSADGVAHALSESMPPLEGEERRLALTLIRMLAEGEPVSTAAFAEQAGLDPQAVERLVDGVPGLYRDDAGRVIAFLGLSLGETPHRFEVDGATLYAWCAWDTLFLPRMIGKAARLRPALDRALARRRRRVNLHEDRLPGDAAEGTGAASVRPR